MEIKGNVKFVGETEVFDSGFQKRLLVIESIDGDYTNQYGCEVFKDNVTRFDGLTVGEAVTVTVFDNTVGKCHEWNGRWFGDLPTCMKVHKEAAQPPADDDGDDLDVTF